MMNINNTINLHKKRNEGIENLKNYKVRNYLKKLLLILLYLLDNR